MEKNTEVKEKIVRTVILVLIVLTFLIFPVAAFGYFSFETHPGITSEAIERSIDLKEVLTEIGFEKGTEHKITGFEIKSVKEWIQYGSRWEDMVIFHYKTSELIRNCHFYNPINNKGLYEIIDNQENEIGQSLITRAHDSDNEWSYQMVKDMLYAALSGNSEKYSTWWITDRISYPH